MVKLGERDKIENLLGYFPDDVSSLSRAVLCDDRGTVEAQLRTGASPNRREPGGLNPVLIAAALSRPAILEDLLRAGGDPNSYETDTRSLALQYALSAGIHYDDWRAYELLLTRADINFRPPTGATIAEDATALGAIDKVLDLLDRGYHNDLPGLAKSLEVGHFTQPTEALRLKALERTRALVKAQQAGR